LLSQKITGSDSGKRRANNKLEAIPTLKPFAEPDAAYFLLSQKITGSDSGKRRANEYAAKN
jgi:hypothetical protein